MPPRARANNNRGGRRDSKPRSNEYTNVMGRVTTLSMTDSDDEDPLGSSQIEHDLQGSEGDYLPDAAVNTPNDEAEKRESTDADTDHRNNKSTQTTDELTLPTPQQVPSSMVAQAVEEAAKTWLVEAQEWQQENFPQVTASDMGTWVVEVSAKHHECHNVLLFQSLTQSTEIERQVGIWGYGTVVIRVLRERDSRLPLDMKLESVRYMRANNMNVHHKFGRLANADMLKVYLPKEKAPDCGGQIFVLDEQQTHCAVQAKSLVPGLQVWALRIWTEDSEKQISSRKRGRLFSNW